MNETPTEKVRRSLDQKTPSRGLWTHGAPKSKEKITYRLTRPEMTAAELINAKRKGLSVRKVSRGIPPEDYGKVYSIDRYRVKVTGNPEDIERQVKEARKKEQQLKAEYKRELKRVSEEIISILSELGKEEANSALHYQKLSTKYSAFPTVQKILSEASSDELKHSNQFFDLVHELRRELEKELAK